MLLFSNYNNKKDIINLLIFFSLFFLVNSNNCRDEYCENCSGDGSICFACKNDLIKYQYQCVKKCKKIKDCILSNINESICLKCDYGCKPDNGICTCTLKYILYIISLLIIIITVGVFLFCLTHNTCAIFFIRNTDIRFRPFNNNIEINNSIGQMNLNNNEINKTEEDYLEEFYKNKIVLKDNCDIEKMNCYCCKNSICNLYLDCGCYLCFDCEKKSIKDNNCLNCHKEFNSMSQVSCSICLNNKKDLGIFNCQCKMVVCKDCYIKWRLKNKNCPTCRTIIN